MDIRLENILIDNNGDIRLCDFGNALTWSGLPKDLVKAGTVAGTLSHMPPEMLRMEEDYSAEKCDMWESGLVLYELLTGKPLFEVKKDDQEVIKRIITGKFEPLGIGFTADARDLCESLLAENPEDRPSCREVLQHPWFQKEMHKPAIAKGIVFLDPAPTKSNLKKCLESILEKENISITTMETSYLLKLKCVTKQQMVFTIVAELICDDSKEISSFELEYVARQAVDANQKLDNYILQ